MMDGLLLIIDFHYMTKKQLVKRRQLPSSISLKFKPYQSPVIKFRLQLGVIPFLARLLIMRGGDGQSKYQITFDHINQNKKKLLLKVDAYNGVFVSLFQKDYKIKFYRHFTRTTQESL